MSALNLLSPSGADFNFSVCGVGAVADYKMVAQSVGHIAMASMGVVEDVGVAVVGSAVMTDYMLPAMGVEVIYVDPVSDSIQEGCSGSRYSQPLSDSDQITGQSVRLFDGGYADLVAEGQVGEGVSRYHDVNHFTAPSGREKKIFTARQSADSNGGPCEPLDKCSSPHNRLP